MSSRPIISLSDIHKSYISGDTKVHALRGISLEFARGEFVAIVGSSGSGKSTLMNILGLLDKQDAGGYLLDGRDVSGLSPDESSAVRRRSMGFIFQSFNLLPRVTAEENVELPLLYAGVSASQRRKRAVRLLESMGLVERRKHMPSQLSGGQQQRVAIARALCAEPMLILADEPTGNLDSANSLETMNLLKKVNGDGTTIVMITHDAEVAAYADTVCRMKDGAFL